MITKHFKTVILFVLILISAGSCLKGDKLNQDFDSYEPIDLNDGLILSTPEDENMNATELTTIYDDVYNDENLWSLRSLLVFRNEKIVAETYLKDYEDITNKQIVWSCTKQVMGVLTGIAIDEGLIDNINDPISNYFDEELLNHSDKDDITIKNLITMRSGINYSNDEQTDDILQIKPDNSIELILDRPVNATQGTEFHYNDGNPHLLSGLIQKVTGVPTDEWAEEFLFSKIEMTNYNWVRYKDGVTLGGFGIETTPRELSKIALCVSNNGKWKGEKVINENWIDQMTAAQVPINNSDFSFGYFWWVDVTRNIHFMWGVGGQFAFIVPNKNLVIVMTSFPNTKGEYEIQADEALKIVDRILETAF